MNKSLKIFAKKFEELLLHTLQIKLLRKKKKDGLQRKILDQHYLIFNVLETCGMCITQLMWKEP